MIQYLYQATWEVFILSFIDDFRDVKNKVRTDITQSQLIFEETLRRSGYDTATAQTQYDHIYDILAARDTVHADIVAAGLTEDVKVTGAVTELLCQIALEASAPTRYDTLPKTWDWIGDFAIMGSPFNLFVSVKSYKAKERLIVSGTGQNAAPVVGYGLFDDPSEWSPDRVKQYKQRGFIAIYMPNTLYNTLAAMTPQAHGLSPRLIRKYSPTNGYPATNIKNIYDRPLLRKLEDFDDDIAHVCVPGNYSLDLSLY